MTEAFVTLLNVFYFVVFVDAIDETFHANTWRLASKAIKLCDFRLMFFAKSRHFSEDFRKDILFVLIKLIIGLFLFMIGVIVGVHRFWLGLRFRIRGFIVSWLLERNLASVGAFILVQILKNFNRFWVNYSHHTTNLTTERMALL